ncbi:MAG TPA: glycosyl hydrolase [Chloroflexota bacterium]|nr:glycosyl hydrolase [Chloroflexota bacterium]
MVRRVLIAGGVGLIVLASPVMVGRLSQPTGSYARARPTAVSAHQVPRATGVEVAQRSSDAVQLTVQNLSAQPAALVAGGKVTFSAAIVSNTTLSNLIVSLEVYNAAWSNVYTVRTTHDVAAGILQRLAVSWSVPANRSSGIYHVLVNVFGSDWAPHYAETCCNSLVVVNASHAIALGAWVPGANWNPHVVDSYAHLVGAYPRIINYYQSWLPPNVTSLNVGLLNTYRSHGATTMISWEPDVPDRKILDGSYDAFIHQYARAAAMYGKPFYLRFAWEKNGNWSAWSPGLNGNTSASYVAAWRHVHDIFVAEHATNVRWVWAPNVAFHGSTPFAEVYPGDEYVDWVALDGYNWGAVGAWHSWTSAYQTFGPSLLSLMALTNKPIMISEIASTELGGDKAAWIDNWFLHDLPAYFPRVRAVVWFDEKKETDWRVNSSPRVLAAFRQVVANPLYQGRLP